MPFSNYPDIPPVIPADRLRPLPPQEQLRTARHLALLPEETQQRFAAARVCVIGAGGLGSPLLYALAAAGVGTLGHITICDDDVVDITNLQRQTLYTMADVDCPKAEAATERLTAINPALTIYTQGRFTADNAEQLCAEHDLLIDGSDNFATRFLAADAAELTGTPLVWGVVLRYSGQVSVFWHPHGPGLRDLFPAPPKKPVQNCAEAGVLGATTAVIGNLMATEALKVLGGFGSPLIGRVLDYDAAESTTRTFTLYRDPERPTATRVEQPAVADPVCAVPGVTDASDQALDPTSAASSSAAATSPSSSSATSPSSAAATSSPNTASGTPQRGTPGSRGQEVAGQSGPVQEISPSALKDFLADATHILLDVRQPHERLIERIDTTGAVVRGVAPDPAESEDPTNVAPAGADVRHRDVFIPLDRLGPYVGKSEEEGNQPQAFPPAGTTAVAVYCAGGVRSAKAVKALQESGRYSGVEFYSVAGGVQAVKATRG